MMTEMLSELTHSIYSSNLGLSKSINQLDMEGYGEMAEINVALGLFVTLVPKLIPYILPHFISESTLQERYSSRQSFEHEVEAMFRQKLDQNLEVIERLLTAWQGESERHVFATRQDEEVERPAKFQSNLVQGIHFLRAQLARTNNKNDQIVQVAENAWNVIHSIYDSVMRIYGVAVDANLFGNKDNNNNFIDQY